jgi:hypothetical protein
VKTILYSQRQVALMVKVACFYSANFAQAIGESAYRVRRIADQKAEPSPAILRHFDLCKQGSAFAWVPR